MKYTNFKSNEKFMIDTFTDSGIYKNTDEFDFVDYCIPLFNRGCVFNIVSADFDDVSAAFKTLIDESKIESNEPPAELLALSSKNMITEEFALKLVATIINK